MSKKTFFLSESEEIFKILDSDNNGYIDKKELETNIKKIKSEFSKEVIDLIFLEADLNKDKKIVFEELKHFVKSKDKILLELFNYLDPERKGFINKKNLKKSFQFLNYKIKKRHIEKLINNINKDNKKKLTLKKIEIEELLKSLKNSNELNSNLKSKLEDLLQKIYKKKIVIKEKYIDNFLTKINKKEDKKKIDKKKEIEILLNKIDKENDNKITFIDFIKYHHIYPIENIRNLFDEFNRESIDLGDSDIFHCTVYHLTPFLTISAAFSARIISRTLTAPFERVKIEMQVSEKKFAETFFDIKKNGWKCFFQGNGTNVLKILPELSIKFLTYDFLQKRLSKDKKNPTIKERMISGILAGAFSQTLIYSFDIAKTRLTLTGKSVYKGPFDCIRQIIKKEGKIKRFFGSL